ncbi:MAG: hypothetical protein QME58_06220 [Bacteroidota bacterium]|nr:hypothetical protein [Bacteroidota bacterium]
MSIPARSASESKCGFLKISGRIVYGDAMIIMATNPIISYICVSYKKEKQLYLKLKNQPKTRKSYGN